VELKRQSNLGSIIFIDIGVEAFEALLGIAAASTDQRRPVTQLRQEFRQALADAGYHTKEELLDLVREVKQELADERQGITAKSASAKST